MTLSTGAKLGPYEIVSPLGAGGMGEVYRARDTKLRRDVAIKVLPASVASDPERLERFEREAHLLASLNHPNIGSIYGFEDTPGMCALVLEVVEGDTLAERLKAGPLPMRETLTIARQIADALEAAHERGIIHRDLKPANVKVTPDGTVKVLDFGLAKALTGDAPGSDLTSSPTVTAGWTGEGVLLGTAAYMSPEQARGKALDKRTDVWSFGCVLYEMLTGRLAFQADNISDTIVAVLGRDPNWTALPETTPASVLRLLQRCLEKDRKRRLRDIGDARIELDDALAAPSGPLPRSAAVVEHRQGRNRFAWSLGGGLLVALAAAVVLIRGRLTESSWTNPLENAQFTRLTDFEGTELDASVSSDGRFVVFLANRDGPFDAWLTQVGTGEFKNLTAGRFTSLDNEVVRVVGFSADTSKVWLSVNNEKGFMDSWILPTLGGSPRLFLPLAVHEAWSPDGSKLVYHQGIAGDPIFVADRDGSNGKRIFIERPGYHCHFQTWSPDGRYIYFVRGVVVTRQMDIWRIPASGGQPERITHHQNWVVAPTVLDERTLLYSSPADDGSGPWLYAVDVERRVPRRVSLGVEHYTSISATADGKRLVATVSNPTGHLWTLPVRDHPVGEAEAREVEGLPNVRAVSPRYGPNYFLYLSSRGGGDSLWKFQNGAALELWKGSEDGQISSPAVSADGAQVCFTFRKQGRGVLYVMNADGTGIHTLDESLNVNGAPSWSPNGKWLAVGADKGQGPRLFKVPVDGGVAVQLLDEMAFNPVWSPDDRLIVYSGPNIGLRMSVMAVTPEGKACPFPNLTVRFGGERYRFLADGKQLVFMRGDSQRQEFSLLDLDSGKERPLSRLSGGFSMRSFDISRDGTQILFDRVRENSDIVLIDLKR